MDLPYYSLLEVTRAVFKENVEGFPGERLTPSELCGTERSNNVASIKLGYCREPPKVIPRVVDALVNKFGVTKLKDEKLEEIAGIYECGSWEHSVVLDKQRKLLIDLTHDPFDVFSKLDDKNWNGVYIFPETSNIFKKSRWETRVERNRCPSRVDELVNLVLNSLDIRLVT
jgi:hypothetical protein